jgi:hypothetical protein
MNLDLVASPAWRDLPQPPTLAGSEDRITAFATWQSVLDQDIRKILSDGGVQPEPAVIPPVRGAIHAAAS